PRRPPAAPIEPSQFVLMPPEQTHFDSDSNSQSISPDGHQIAFVARGADGRSLLWIRPVDSLAARPLAGTDESTWPFWSPDGRALGGAAWTEQQTRGRGRPETRMAQLLREWQPVGGPGAKRAARARPAILQRGDALPTR